MALTSITKDFVIKAGALTEGVNIVTSSTAQTGTLQVNGGAAIAKNLIVGSTATVWGATNLNGNLTVTGYTQAGLFSATQFTATNAVITNNESVGGTFTATGSAFFGNTLNVTGNAVFNGAVNTFSGALFVTGTNIFTVGTGQSSFGGVVAITNNTTANSGANTGALVVTGGTVIGDNLAVKSTAYNTATNTANAIYTAGGIYTDGGLTVGSNGPTLFKGPVTFSGTATYVLSTNTFYTDNILEIHTPQTGVYTPWFVDDGKDIGFRFHYYTNSTDTNAALVLANDTKYLEWYNTGAESGTGNFTGAGYGTFKTGAVILAGGAANAGNTSSGALQVLGGAGISGAVYSGGNGSFATLTGRNLTTASGILLSDASGNIVNSQVTYNYTTNRLVGTIDLANTATNIVGGATGSLVYQSNASQTTTLPIGTTGQLLYVTGGLPTWVSPSGLTAGTANTASNIAGGLANQIPYQSAPGSTVFNANMTFNGTTFTATNIVASSGNNATSSTGNSGALMVVGGAGFTQDIWVGGNINVNGNIYLRGAGLDTLSSTTGTFVNVAVTGTGVALTVSNSATVGGQLIVNSTQYSTSTLANNALYVAGGIGVAKTLSVGSDTYITGNLTVGGTVTATNLQLQTLIANSGTFYGDTTGNAALYAGIVGGTIFPQTVIQATGNKNDYMEFNIQNINSGAKASTDIVASADNVTLSNGYIDMGIASSTFDGTQVNSLGTALGPNDGYLMVGYNTSPGLGDLVFGTLSTGTQMRFVLSDGATSVTSAMVAMTVNKATTQVSSTNTGVLTVNGGVGVAGGLFVGGIITGTTLSVTGNETVGGNLTVTGFTGLNGGATISAATVTNTLTVGTTLGVTGRTTLGDATAAGFTATTANVTGTLSVTGRTTLGDATAAGFTATTANVTGNETIGGNLTVTGYTQVTLLTATTFTATSANILGAATVNANFTVVGQTSLGSTSVGNFTATTANVTGNETVGGTLSVTGRTTLNDVTVNNTITATNLIVTGTATLPSNVSLSNLTVTNLTVTNNETVGGNLSVANLFTATGAAVFGSTTVHAGIANFNSTQDSNATNNGSIITAGGIGVAKNIVIGSAATIGSVSTQTVVPAVYSNNSLYSSYTSGFIVTNSNINLDTYSATAYRTAKYIVQIVDGTKIHVEEILVFHDGTNVYLTEYGISTSQGELGTFDANLAANTITVTFQANYTPTSMTIKLVRTAITL